MATINWRGLPRRGSRSSDSPAWPLAVGAVIAPHDFTGRPRSKDRLTLALGAYKLGYYLLDLIDIPAWESLNWAGAWSPVWELVERAGAEAVVVFPRVARQVPPPPGGMRNVRIRQLPPDD